MTHPRATLAGLKFNAAAVLCARLTVPALNVVLVIVIARSSGLAALGQYTLLLTLFLLADSAKSMGLHNLAIREISKGASDSLLYYKSLIRISMIASLAIAPFLLLIAGLTSSSLYLPMLIMALGLLPSSFVTSNDALFLALGKAGFTTTVTLIESFVRLVASLLIVLEFGGGILSLALAHACTRVLAAIIGCAIVRRSVPGIPAQDSTLTRMMIRSAPGFFGVFVLPTILFRLDILLLGLLAGEYSVGVYSIAMRLFSVLVLVPDSIMSASFAVLSRFAGHDERVNFERLVDSTLQLLAAFLQPVAIALSLFAPFILQTLFGDKSEAAIPILQILAWALVPFSATRAIGDALVASGRQSGVALSVLGATALSAASYMLLIHTHSVTGAAIGFAVSVVTLLIILMVYQDTVSRPVTSWKRLLRSLAPGLLSAITFFTVEAPARIIAVVLVYVLAISISARPSSERRPLPQVEGPL